MKSMLKRSFIILFLSLLVFPLRAQPKIDKVEPPFWWVGMNEPSLQLMVYGENIANAKVMFDYEHIDLVGVKKTENPNYWFVDLFVSPDAQAGKYKLIFQQNGEDLEYEYEFRERRQGSRERAGFDASDVIYLLMPDRFANGDQSNDNMPGMKEQADRSNPDGRHGGDLKGIEDNLEYLQDLGVTTLWVNPLLENNMPEYSYHGYAITDFYKVDPRYGSNEDYLNFIQKCHSEDIKVVMDMVFNHCGLEHWWMKDIPSADWIHHYPDFVQTNFRTGTVIDPHASKYDRDKTTDGWFVATMPDLNQDNEYLANYLIQNSIWWIENADLDGIRMDTYPYADKEFMADWMKRINYEYPDFNVVGESWLEHVGMLAWWQEGSNVKSRYYSNLKNLFDFPMYYTLGKAFNEENGWSQGIARLYETLSQDFLYYDPNSLVIFADNHDTDRFFTKIEEDPETFKLAMAFLMTTRGIPMIYYGTEIGMTGFEHEGHGFIREDFPGGWPDDERNAMTASGRTEQENELYNYLQNLMKWRKDAGLMENAKLTHFIPEDGTYVYFRHNNTDCLMVILNNTDEQRILSTENYAECMKDFTSGKDIVSGANFKKLDVIQVPAKTAMIIELLKKE